MVLGLVRSAARAGNLRAELRRLSRRAARRVTLVVIGGASLLIALVFLLISAWFCVAEVTSPVKAGLILGGAWIVIGLICLWTGLHRPRRETTPLAALAAGLGEELGAIEQTIRKTDPIIPLTGAFLLGLFLTRRGD